MCMHALVFLVVSFTALWHMCMVLLNRSDASLQSPTTDTKHAEVLVQTDQVRPNHRRRQRLEYAASFVTTFFDINLIYNACFCLRQKPEA
jgi:hypothetical protein